MKLWQKSAALALTAALTVACFGSDLTAVGDTGFSDVDANAPYAEAVIYCRERGLMAGVSNTMMVYPIGKVTSDLSIFPDLPSRIEITFEVVR